MEVRQLYAMSLNKITKGRMPSAAHKDQRYYIPQHHCAPNNKFQESDCEQTFTDQYQQQGLLMHTDCAMCRDSQDFLSTVAQL